MIDCSNPVDWQDGPRVREDLQVPETLRRHWVDARLVKAFNTVGSAQVLHPTVNGQPIDLFLCGDDEEAKETVSRLGTGLGFHPVDSGPLRNAPLLEHLAVLLMSLSAHSFRGRSITLKLEAE
ncbi:MAG: hypothetical protein D6762_02680 [Candidatus Neomarinimicrobiota bacterium]|nr:MAG: hypothetical protein D6762_02680 [Candidatus Neomarinimicrobiota bacterium]